MCNSGDSGITNSNNNELITKNLEKSYPVVLHTDVDEEATGSF